MQQTNQDAIFLARDNQFGDENQVTGPDQPFTESEIEDLLYNDILSASERLGRLRQYRDELASQQSLDFGDHDSRAIVGEIDRAIERLSDAAEGLGDTTSDVDPLEHRETLSPDDDALLDAADEDDSEEGDLFADGADATEEPLDAAEWEDGDGFDSDKGVR